MPPSQRITIRLSPVLAARLAATVGPQGNVADIVRHAIEAYLDDDSASWQPRQTREPPAAATMAAVADTLAAINARLTTSEQRLEALEALAAQPDSRDDLQAQLTGLTARLQALESQVDTLTAHVVALATEEQPRAARGSQRAAIRQLAQLEQPAGAHEQPAQPLSSPTHYGRPGLAPETLQAIAQERAHHPALTMQQFAQHLFDQDVYRGRARDGREVPADHSRLRRWLQQARQQA